MGILDRLTEAADDIWDRGFEIGRGPARGIKAIGDFVADLAEAPFTQDEYSGFFATIYDSFVKRGGEGLAATFGPDTGLGAAAGALPEGVRGGLWAPVDKVLEGAETVYREGVAEPISAALTASSLADAPGGGGMAGLLNPEHWREGYRIAQDRSPGQAFAIAIGTKDVNDVEEMERFAATPAYRIWSGTADAVLRFRLDPTVVAGKSVKVARGLYRTSEGLRSTRLASQADVALARDSHRISGFVEGIEKAMARGDEAGAAARVRHQFFPDHSDGAFISDLIVNAPDTLTRRRTVAALMGSVDDYTALTATRADVAHQIRNLTTDYSLALLREEGRLLPDGAATAIKAELDALYPQMQTFAKLDQTAGTLTEVPRYSRTGELRARVTSSATYQKNPLTAPARVATNMMPRHWLDLNDPRRDIDIARMLKRSDLSIDEQDAIRSRYGSATSAAERQRIAVEAEEQAARSILDTYGVPKDVVDDIVQNARRARQTAMGTLSRRKYDAKGRGSVQVQNEMGGFDTIHLPLHVTQQADLIPLADLDALRHAAQAAQGWNIAEAGVRGSLRNKYRAGRLGVSDEAARLEEAAKKATDPAEAAELRRRAAIAQTTAARRSFASDFPAEGMEMFYSVWRPATLLRVGWPARVLMDEQLRIIATIGSMAHSMQLAKKGVPEMGDRIASATLRHLPASRSWRRVAKESVEDRARSRYGGFDVDGYRMPGPWGSKGDAAEVMLRLNSSSGSFREWVIPDHDGLLSDMRQKTGQWRTITAGDFPEEFPDAWQRAVNGQIGQAALARRIMGNGGDVDDAVRWLMGEGDDLAVPFLKSAERIIPDEARGQVPADFREIYEQWRMDDGVYELVHNRRPDAPGYKPDANTGPEWTLARLDDEGRAIAEAHFDVTDRGIEVHQVYVEEALRRQGLNKGLSGALEEMARTEGYDLYRTTVVNPIQEGHLRRAGYEPLDDFTPYSSGRYSDAQGANFVRRFGGGRPARSAQTDGPAYANEMNWRPHTFRQHAEDVADQIDRYLPGDLRTLALERDLVYSDLQRVTGNNPEVMPAVHAEELAQALGMSGIKRTAQDYVAKAWEALGKTPTDVLSRNPFFDYLYRTEATRLTRLLDDGDLTPAQLDNIAWQARRKALNESQNLLYDLAEKSQFTHIVRFLMPFYSAWQEVLTRWAGITVQNPAFVARMRLVWNSPEKAGLVQDENGMQVDENGRAHDPLTGDFVEAGADRFITLPFAFPGAPGGMPVRFNKKSFNLALTGAPGMGPPVQIPVNEIVKARPELEESLRFVLPFGTTRETWELMLPASAKRAFALAEGTENRLFTNTALRIHFDRMTDVRLGKRDPYDSPEEAWEDAQQAASDLFKVRFVASYVLPFAPVFDSPYQPWINSYRNAMERQRDDPAALGTHGDGTPVTADEWFLDTFGEEYFFLTQSLSKSNDQVPPTIEGYQARERYEDLIEKFPDLGGLIIGEEGAGEFARAVYDSQLSNPVRPGSSDQQRGAYSFEEAAAAPDVRLGWMKYSKAMDLIDVERSKRGLPNLNVTAAADLAIIKRAVIEQLAEAHPSWWEQFNKQDRLAWTKRLEGLRAIADDPRLDRPDRQDIVGLRVYLKARDLFIAELAKREHPTLTASANQDLALLWSTVQSQLVDKYPAFGPTFYRWLERDPLED